MTFRFREFEIDIARQEMRRDGAIVHTEPQVFDLLVHLIRNRDRIVRKDELIDVVWQGRIVSEATLSSRISAARRALGDSGNDQSLIRTLHRRGFRFVGDVADDNSEPPAITMEKTPLPQDAADDAAKLVPIGEPLPLVEKRAVAALPSQNIGRDPDLEYSADDLSHGERRVDPASVMEGTNSTGRRAARNLLFAGVGIGVASLMFAAAWWLPSSSGQSPTPYMKGPVALATEANRRPTGSKRRPCRSSPFHSSISAAMRSRTTWPTASPTVSSAI